MRTMILLAALAAATTLALPAHAGWQHWSLDEHSTDNTLTWSNSEGRSLDLESADGKGAVIVKIEATATYGLEPGDVIIAVNHHAVKHVADLITLANANEHGSVTIELQRGHKNQQISIVGSDLYTLIHPHP